MNSSDHTSKLPTWLFIVTDLALLAAAALVAISAGDTPSKARIVTVVTLVVLGAACGLIPLILRHERQKNEALDERQRALEALSRTVAASAEQIGIAANGLHEIAEIAQKNLRTAEHLPQKLQEKIAEFQAQLSQASDTDKEELERELLALRTSESERLDAVSQRIAKSSADWAKLETATQQHLTAATEALAKLHRVTADAIGKAQAAAEQALAQARTEAARSLGETSGAATRTIESAKSAALAELETKLAATTTAAEQLAHKLETTSRNLDEKLARLATSPAPAAVPPAIPASDLPTTPAADVPPAAAAPDPLAPAQPASPPKRPRKTRREDTPADTPAAAASASETAPPSVPAALEPTPAPVVTASPAEEPPPIPAEKFSEITPVAPHTAEPFAGAIETTPPAAESLPAEAAPAPEPTATSTPAPISEPVPASELPAADSINAEPPKSPRKRPIKKTEPALDPEPTLGLDLDDPASRAAAAGVLERVLSSDGATRLLVTAYIGIGNRLFIRGEGPGLSWEKGVPLQFVSIGKWRWETNDANGPVQFKLYKNDDLECAALGQQTLEPGHQQEVTAAF